MSTEFHAVDRPRRWNVAFGSEMTDADATRIAALAPFRDMDPGRFPRHLSLENILRYDTRVRRFETGEIIVRAGDYGHSAFMVVAGEVRVMLSELPPSLLGRRETKRMNLFRVIAQLWNHRKEPEQQTPAELAPRPELVMRAGADDQVRIFLQDVPRLLDRSRTATIGQGEFFGEIAALSRMPRTATVIAGQAVELLEIRWQGLRDLMRYDEQLLRHIEQIYHDRSLAQHLAALPIFGHLNEEQLAAVMRATAFGTYGQYEWSGEYKRLAQSDPGLRAGREPAIAIEGDYPEGVILIRAGFARLCNRYGKGERTLNYLGAGHTYGLSEIVRNWRNPAAPVALEHTLRAMGYTHILRIPTVIMEELVLPSIPPEELGRLVPGADAPAATAPAAVAVDPDVSRLVGPELFEFMTDNRFFNGTASMVIDMDRCTRCDDCVRACAAAHDNNPRFLRHGPRHGALMVANACMHCVDPVCMIGCPTGAINRDRVGGQVVINPVTCIGCKTCFNNCPYDAIRMVEIRDDAGAIIVDQELKPILKATKCDYCIEQWVRPACQQACPHGAMTRMNLNNLHSLVGWLQR